MGVSRCLSLRLFLEAAGARDLYYSAFFFGASAIVMPRGVKRRVICDDPEDNAAVEGLMGLPHYSRYPQSCVTPIDGPRPVHQHPKKLAE